MAGEERQKRPAAVSLIYTQCPVIGCLREALTLIAHGASVQKHSTIGPRSHFFNAITVHFSVNNKNQRQSWKQSSSDGGRPVTTRPEVQLQTRGLDSGTHHVVQSLLSLTFRSDGNSAASRSELQLRSFLIQRRWSFTHSNCDKNDAQDANEANEQNKQTNKQTSACRDVRKNKRSLRK